MLYLTSLAAVSASGAAGSIKFDAKTHKAVGSSGCGSKSPYSLGSTTVATGEYAGVTWTYRVTMPSSYDSSTPIPIILQHPGWGLTAAAEQSGAGIAALVDELNFIAITPQGMNDNDAFGGPWYSWNCVGSTASPGPAGPTCTQAAVHTYCYNSCPDKRRRLEEDDSEAAIRNKTAAAKASDPDWGSYSYSSSYSSSYGSSYSYGGGTDCGDSPQCWWTTCDETVTPTGTGTKSVGGFIPGLYDTLEEQLCVDTTREYCSGESNGGMQTYQLGVDLAERLAAITPEVRAGTHTRTPSPNMAQNRTACVLSPSPSSLPSSVRLLPQGLRDGSLRQGARPRPPRLEGHDRPRKCLSLCRWLVLYHDRRDLQRRRVFGRVEGGE